MKALKLGINIIKIKLKVSSVISVEQIWFLSRKNRR